MPLVRTKGQDAADGTTAPINPKGSTGSWDAPFEASPSTNALIFRRNDPDRDQKRTPRLDPKNLPKFRHDEDLEEWLFGMGQRVPVETYGETFVCLELLPTRGIQSVDGTQWSVDVHKRI